MSRSHKEYLQHILDEIDFLVKSSEQLTKKDFLKNDVLKRAFVRSIEIIGEAVKNIPAEIKVEHSDVDWKAIAGTRDKLIHGYFGVDYEIVRDIVKNEAPNLRNQVVEILEKYQQMT